MFFVLIVYKQTRKIDMSFKHIVQSECIPQYLKILTVYLNPTTLQAILKPKINLNYCTAYNMKHFAIMYSGN